MRGKATHRSGPNDAAPDRGDPSPEPVEREQLEPVEADGLQRVHIRIRRSLVSAKLRKAKYPPCSGSSAKGTLRSTATPSSAVT